MTETQQSASPVSIGYAGLACRCPACGIGKLYHRTLLTVATACPHCRLDFSNHEQGDGPAFAGIVIIGTLAAIGAVILDMVATPPFWVHTAIWLPFVTIGSILCLRIGKAAIIAWQYQVKREDFSK